MSAQHKERVAVIYDSLTGRIVSSHREMRLDGSDPMPADELEAEARKLAAGDQPLSQKWGSVVLEMTRREAGTLTAVHPKTLQPEFPEMSGGNGPVSRGS